MKPFEVKAVRPTTCGLKLMQMSLMLAKFREALKVSGRQKITQKNLIPNVTYICATSQNQVQIHSVSTAQSDVACVAIVHHRARLLKIVIRNETQRQCQMPKTNNCLVTLQYLRYMLSIYKVRQETLYNDYKCLQSSRMIKSVSLRVYRELTADILLSLIHI